MVPRAGVEPARPFGQRILSPQRLPFRHPGMLSVSRNSTKPFSFLLIINTETLITWCVEDAGVLFQIFRQDPIAAIKRLLGPPGTHQLN